MPAAKPLRPKPSNPTLGFQGKEEVFHFLETVLLEVLQLFPSSYIHIGGDEVRCVSLSQCDRRSWCTMLM